MEGSLAKKTERDGQWDVSLSATITAAHVGEKQVFHEGESVEGSINIELLEPLKVKGVRIYLFGQSLVFWTDIISNEVFLKNYDVISLEKHFVLTQNLLGKKVGEKSPGNILDAGNHKFHFKFHCLQKALPSSFEGRWGANRYWLKAEIEKPFPWPNTHHYTSITVHEQLDINTASYTKPVSKATEKQVSKILGLGNAGTLKLWAKTDRNGYCAGEAIAITALVKNTSIRDLGKLKAKLIQRSVFKASGDQKVDNVEIRCIVGKTIKAGTNYSWKNQLLSIGFVPPSSVCGFLHNIDVSYYVQMIVEIPYAFDLKMTLPIVIGTVPWKGGQPQAAAACAISAADQVVSYHPCMQGCCKFSKSHQQFPSLWFVPYCAFVPGYKFTSNDKGKAEKLADVKDKNVAKALHQSPKIAALLPPPSYEEAVFGIRKSTAKPRSPPIQGAVLIIRYHADNYKNFIAQIQKAGDGLRKTGGKIAACPEQVTVRKGVWPENQLVALFVFPTKDQAKEWFVTTQRMSDRVWLSNCDAFVHNVKDYQPGKNFFVFSTVDNLGKSEEEMARYLELYKTKILPLRKSNSSSQISGGKVNSLLQGEWNICAHTFTVSQWNTKECFSRYVELLNQQHKEWIKLGRELYVVHFQLTFQSETDKLLEITSQK